MKEFSDWLKGWLARHPVKEPRFPDATEYTARVMEKIRETGQPARAPSIQPWFIWPRPVFVTAAAVALVCLVALSVWKQPQGRMAKEDQQEKAIAALGEPSLTYSDPESASEMVSGESELMMLAEDSSDDEAWIEETLALLEEADEDFLEDSANDDSDDDLLDELEMLDLEEDLPASS